MQKKRLQPFLQTHHVTLDVLFVFRRAIEGLVGFAVGSDPIVKAELAVDPGQYGALIGVSRTAFCEGCRLYNITKCENERIDIHRLFTSNSH